MKISKFERIYLIRLLIERGMTKKQAENRIDEDNGFLVELTSKLRKKKIKEKKERGKRFGEEFRKMKTKS